VGQLAMAFGDPGHGISTYETFHGKAPYEIRKIKRNDSKTYSTKNESRNVKKLEMTNLKKSINRSSCF
jgi:hypothetical protein